MLHALLATLTIAAAPDTGKHVFFTADAGLIMTDGNTDLTSVSAGNKLIIKSGGWKFTQVFGVTYARNHDTVTASLWQGALRGDRSLTPHVGLYLLTEFERNTFAGVRTRVSPSFGVAALVVAAERDTLKFEVGGGYTAESAVAAGADRNYASGRIAAVYRHRLGAHSAFDQAIEYLPNFKTGADYRIASVTSVTAPITTGVAMKASYVIHYEGVPQPGFKTTDKILTTGIQVTL